MKWAITKGPEGTVQKKTLLLIATVEPVHNGHLGNGRNWSLWRGVCYEEIDFLGVTPLNELQANSTPPIPPYPGLRGEFSLPPPDSVVISSMENPPYVLFDEEPLEKSENITSYNSSQPGEAMNATNDNSGINQESKQENKDDDGNPTGFRVTGIFQEIVSKGLQICVGIPLTKINFTKKAGNLQQLDKTIVKNEADLALPVQGS
ncbi:unnamed protein product [Porites evermanni]|uniref:Uncharacterized protein n=1 Tax=Porites evermanni TaxID=104178 RepID=A0ABN8M0A0_9CNID|nr:unnamed protein product [Porites evermanni]